MENPSVSSLWLDVDGSKYEAEVLNAVQEVCATKNIRADVKELVLNIITETELSNYQGLHKINSVNERISNLLETTSPCMSQLSYDEQRELQNAVIKHLLYKSTEFLDQINNITDNEIAIGIKKNTSTTRCAMNLEDLRKSQSEFVKKLKKASTQEKIKIDLMREKINFFLQEALKYDENSSAMHTLKSELLSIKSKIINIQILQSIFSELSCSIKAHSEFLQDLKESIAESTENIKRYKNIISQDNP